MLYWIDENITYIRRRPFSPEFGGYCTLADWEQNIVIRGSEYAYYPLDILTQVRRMATNAEADLVRSSALIH